MRFDKNRKTVHVRIGKQESRYRIVCCTVRQSP